MNELLHISILPVVLTLLAYQAGVFLRQKVKSPLCNPILVAVVLVLIFLSATGMDVNAYRSGNSLLSWLLTPATVSLAVTMYEQFQILRKNIPVILAGVAAGAISCLLTVLALGIAFNYAPEMIISLLPKSVTTAIGVPLAEIAGGLTPITTAAIVVTGVAASVLGPALCKVFHLTSEVAQGVAYGTAGHVVGTSKAMEQSALAGAAGSLSLVLAGLLTAIILPIVTPFL
jgi:putative effector of murein hydrolase